MHRALGIIERACDHTDKWNRDIISNLIRILAPFHVLKPEDSLEIDYIRISTVKTGRLESSVEIHHKIVLGGCLGGLAIEVHHRLVVPVHEIYLEALDTHLGIMPADLFHIFLESPVSCPEDKVHTLRAGV